MQLELVQYSAATEWLSQFQMPPFPADHLWLLLSAGRSGVKWNQMETCKIKKKKTLCKAFKDHSGCYLSVLCRSIPHSLQQLWSWWAGPPPHKSRNIGPTLKNTGIIHRFKISGWESNQTDVIRSFRLMSETCDGASSSSPRWRSSDESFKSFQAANL